MLKGATHNLIVRTRSDVALYVLNNKRAHLRALEERFRILIAVNADSSVTGQPPFVVERGEQVMTLEQAKAIAAQAESNMLPALAEEPEEDIAEEDIAAKDIRRTRKARKPLPRARSPTAAHAASGADGAVAADAPARIASRASPTKPSPSTVWCMARISKPPRAAKRRATMPPMRRLAKRNPATGSRAPRKATASAAAAAAAAAADAATAAAGTANSAAAAAEGNGEETNGEEATAAEPSQGYESGESFAAEPADKPAPLPEMQQPDASDAPAAPARRGSTTREAVTLYGGGGEAAPPRRRLPPPRMRPSRQSARRKSPSGHAVRAGGRSEADDMSAP